MNMAVSLFFLLATALAFAFPSLSIFILSTIPSAHADATLDAMSLLKFKSSVTDDPLSLLKDWQPSPSPNACNWTGITCSTKHSGRVVEIQLSNSRLAGQISPHLGNISFLKVLNLSFSAFSGHIPSSLGRLHRLGTLHLRANRLGGTIPPQLGNLSSLSYLNLAENSLRGTIPLHLGNMSSLIYLNLAYNDLRGGIPSCLSRLTDLEILGVFDNAHLGEPIPPSLGELKNLQVFYASSNGHTGQIPSTLCNCSLLVQLELAGNELTGNIPHCLGSLSQLYYLNLNDNSLSGHIPESVWELTALQILDFTDNNLTGTIPESIGNLNSLRILFLSINRLRGPLPKTLGKLVNLQYINLGFNYFSGRIPDHLANCTHVIVLELMSNELSGPLPPWLGLLSKLERLQLYMNSFTGKIPGSLKNCTELKILELHYNQLGGTIPLSLGQLSRLRVLHLYSNYLVSGVSSSDEAIPALKALYGCSHLTSVELGDNFLRGTLPWDVGMHWPRISDLNLENANISGSIPQSIGNLSSLLNLHLQGNLLSGSIPESCGSMKTLQMLNLSSNNLSGKIPWQITLLNRRLAYLYLSNNKFSGNLPSFIGNLTNLQELALSKNSFSGRIPSELGNCRELLFLDLSFNRFSGAVPSEVADLRHIQTWFDLSGNYLSGVVPAEIGGLNMAEHIDLSGNQLRGKIGFQMGQWLNAQYVNLSFNHFSGEIPESMGKNLTQLQVMDLSHNNFTGQISKYIFNLSQMQHLDVSYNSFQGNVPCPPAFNNRSKFFISHNLQLCSNCFSLPKCKNHKHHRHSFPYNIAVRVCISIGVALILSACIVLFILKRKRKASLTTEMERRFLWISPEEIQAATQNFSTENLIGQGRQGRVYKGVLQGREEVAIKVFAVPDAATSDATSFAKECETLGKVRHRNLMRIITACSRLDFKALILPLMPNSLHKLLHEANTGSSRASLNFEIRLRILRELAGALSYLHHDCSPCIVHCDVKPQNVLLDEEMTVHLSDFGIARLLPEGLASPNSSSAVVGSLGYMAPECGITGRASPKGDVYSFGIVVLEVLTGLMPTHPEFEGDLTLPKWISQKFTENSNGKGAIKKILVSASEKGGRAIETETEEEWRAAEQLVMIGWMCSHEKADERPDMRRVEAMLYAISANVRENDESESESEAEGVREVLNGSSQRLSNLCRRIEKADIEAQIKKKSQNQQESSSSYQVGG